MPKYCPTCGNSSASVAFFGNFCEDCTKKKLASSLPASVELKRCKRCGNIKAVGAFAQPDARSLVSAIGQQLGGGYLIKFIGMDESAGRARLSISEDTPNGTVTVEHEIALEYKGVLCEVCYKKASNYHEAVVQLRGDSARGQRMLEKLNTYVERRNGFITKVEDADNGVNVYVSSKKLASAFMFAMKLKPVVSFTLAGVKKGRRVYKNTYALHFGE